MRRTAALIVGGGPAGAAAAITLARGGERAVVLERTRETGDALCGGFLSWRTLDRLATLGIEPETLNRETVTQVRLFAGTRCAEAPLPRPARAVSRRRLDAALLAAAERIGAGVERGTAVRATDGTRARLGDGGEVAGSALFLASGKHDVRGSARPAAAESDPAMGLRVRAAPHPALDRLVGDAVELHLVRGGYVGIARQEDGGANLCMAVRRSRLREAGDPAALLRELGGECPALAERLAFVEGAIDAVANVPYGWCAAGTASGVYRLGDQAGVIPSLAGEGMGIAVASGISAGRAWLAGTSATAWQPRFAAALRRPVGLAGVIRAGAERRLPAQALVAAVALAPRLAGLAARLTRVDAGD